MSHHTTQHHLLCLLAATLATGAVACVEEPDVALPQARSLQEELLAEEVEALLPGDWVWDHAQPQDAEVELPTLSILFLGHDAVTGDAALLLNLGDDAEQSEQRLQAARVQFQPQRATLWLGEDHDAFLLDTIAEDLLVLQDRQTGARLFYLRAR
jgi:hypothetical protein